MADVRCTKFKSRDEMIDGGSGRKVRITYTPKNSRGSDPMAFKDKVDIRLEIRENDRIECYEFENEDWFSAAVLLTILIDAEKKRTEELLCRLIPAASSC